MYICQIVSVSNVVFPYQIALDELHKNHRYIHGSGLCEDVSVDVHHQVASCCVLHDKTHMLRSLEARKQVDEEGVVRQVHHLKDALLAH